MTDAGKHVVVCWAVTVMQGNRISKSFIFVEPATLTLSFILCVCVCVCACAKCWILGSLPSRCWECECDTVLTSLFKVPTNCQLPYTSFSCFHWRGSNKMYYSPSRWVPPSLPVFGLTTLRNSCLFLSAVLTLNSCLSVSLSLLLPLPAFHPWSA